MLANIFTLFIASLGTQNNIPSTITFPDRLRATKQSVGRYVGIDSEFKVHGNRGRIHASDTRFDWAQEEYKFHLE